MAKTAGARAEDVARASYGKLLAILAARSGDIAQGRPVARRAQREATDHQINAFPNHLLRIFQYEAGVEGAAETFDTKSRG